MKVEVDGGTVYLRDRLDFLAGHAIRVAVAVASEALKASYGVTDSIPDEAVPDLMAVISQHEVLRGVESWSFKEPVTRQNIHSLILDDPNRATVVAAAADNLYQDAVIGPLARLAANSSLPSPTGGPTSVPNVSNWTSEGDANGSTPSPKHPKRSRPSSITSIQMDSTETTSAELAGVSKS